MTQVNVYLAGPILGHTEGDAKDWRDEVNDHMPYGIQGISPLRCEPSIDGTYKASYADAKFGTPQAIAAKNAMDVRRADAVLAYLPQKLIDAQGISIGTIWEIGYAAALNKPIIIVSDSAKVGNHPVLKGSGAWILFSLEEAVELLTGLFSDYVEAI